MDTAGLRETEDRIERLGIGGMSAIWRVRRWCLHAPRIRRASRQQSISSAGARGADSGSSHQSDLASQRDNQAERIDGVTGCDCSQRRNRGWPAGASGSDRPYTGCRQGIVPDLPVLTRTRHLKAIRTARAELGQFMTAWQEQKLPATIAAVHLRTAVHALEELIGGVEVEYVLDRVFSSFCVGK